MLSTKLRPGAIKFLKPIARNRGRELSGSLATQWSASTNRSISTERENHFKDIGYLDDEGLTIFDTIHDMQVRSCDVYAENELFGSYDETENKFKYVTYEEFDKKVDRCRTVLQDLGK
jgi:hypothetical protein